MRRRRGERLRESRLLRRERARVFVRVSFYHVIMSSSLSLSRVFFNTHFLVSTNPPKVG